MSQSSDIKEELVRDFVNAISSIDYKPCYEIENSIQKIVYKTRGLIHKSLSD